MKQLLQQLLQLLLKQVYHHNNRLLDDGYYNIVIDNDKTLSLDSGTRFSNNITVEQGISQSTNKNKIFFLMTLNHDGSITETSTKYVLIPIEIGKTIGVNTILINSKVRINEPLTFYSDMSSDSQLNNKILNINEVGNDNYLLEFEDSENEKLYLTFDSNTLVLKDRMSNQPQQEVKINKVDNIFYFRYETGYYQILYEDDLQNPRIVRLERVNGGDSINSYNMLELDNSSLPNLNNNIEINNIDIKNKSDFNQKSDLRNSFFIQYSDSSQDTNYTDNCFILNKDPNNYLNKGIYLKKFDKKVGLRNGYYFMSYNVGMETYLLTYENNKIIGKKINDTLSSENVINLIKESNGNNIFLIKNNNQVLNIVFKLPIWIP